MFLSSPEIAIINCNLSRPTFLVQVTKGIFYIVCFNVNILDMRLESKIRISSIYKITILGREILKYGCT